uniref:IBR domain-containing protein n=2 Tax=Acanthochromis polyacanthus TaxID=80966 RepID=A0A3Q1GFT5_9TELE
MALLTPEEKKYFEKTLALNAARENILIKACPGCKSSVMRTNKSNLNVCCKLCTSNKGRTFEFCWQCLKEWKGPKPRSDRCGNNGCCNQLLKTLQTCPNVVFETMPGITGCPSIRACPTCGSLLEHSKKYCNFVVCPRCQANFCFVCLQQRHHRSSCTVAPRQTSIPVWHHVNHTRPFSLQ